MAEAQNLPSFCDLIGSQLTCTAPPETTDPVYSNGGVFEFQITQKALEFPSSAKTTTLTVTVNLSPPVQVNELPFFEAPIPESQEVYRTAEPATWSFQLPKVIDTNLDD